MDDPVKGCPVYKNEGCSHIDGYLCDYPDCDIMKKYMKNADDEDRVIDAARKGLEEAWMRLTPEMENLLRMVYRAGYKQAQIDKLERNEE